MQKEKRKKANCCGLRNDIRGGEELEETNGEEGKGYHVGRRQCLPPIPPSPRTRRKKENENFGQKKRKKRKEKGGKKIP